MKTLWQVEIEFVEPMLGTTNKDPEAYEKWIASKMAASENNLFSDEQEARTEEELSTIPATEDLTGTTFAEDDDGLFIYNYMVTGFLKTAQASLAEIGDIPKIKAYKTWLNRLVHISPRKIRIPISREELQVIIRPGRTNTFPPQSILNKSDALPIGTRLSFELLDLGLKSLRVPELLAFGAYQGLGQWTGSGHYGQFRVVNLESEEVK